MSGTDYFLAEKSDFWLEMKYIIEENQMFAAIKRQKELKNE